MIDFLRGQPNSRAGFVRQSAWVGFCFSALFALGACGGGGGGGSDEAQNPAQNAAPVAEAGEAQTIELPTNTVQLTGSATDDQLPANRTLTYAWTGAPEGVTFADAAAASTTATFPGEGTYTLTLTVSDGALSGTDTVQIVVDPQPVAGNAAPTASAGVDQTVVQAAPASLAGTATDDDLPTATLTYQWAVVGDATNVSIADPAALSTTATFAVPGAYELSLTVSDGELTGTDSLIVTVDPAVYPAADTDEAVVDRGWARVAPADAGMDATLLAQAQTYAQTADTATQSGSGMIIRGGQLVHSWGDIDQRFGSQSATKSIGGTVLGLAIDDGLVSLTDRAIDRWSAFGTPPAPVPPPPNDPAQLEQITLLQLATHTAGFEKVGGYGDLLYAPGTTWTYSDGGLNWLADVLTEVFAQDLDVLMTTRVWSALGVNNGNTDDIQWRSNSFRPDPFPSGVAHRELASGMSINANAMARLGLLYLRNGVWTSGRIISESFVNTVRTPPPEIAAVTNADPVGFPGATTNYGVLWWTNTEGLLPNVPTDAYWAWGQGESLVVVIPSLDLVISRIGPIDYAKATRVWGSGLWNGDYDVLAPFLDPIVQSITPAP